MDSLGWEYSGLIGPDDDGQGGADGDVRCDDYDLAALNLFVLLDSMRRENRPLRRRLLAHGRTCRPPSGGS